MEVTIYKKIHCKKVCTEIRELFSHRLDKLEQRVEFPESRVVKERFGIGRPRGLEVYIKDNTKLILWYFPNSRVDKCYRRVEVFATNIITLDFSTRTDFLKTRIIH